MQYDAVETLDTGDTALYAEQGEVPGLKLFPFHDILSIMAGVPLTAEGEAPLHRLVGFIAEDDACDTITADKLGMVRRCLQDQLPFLSEVGFDELRDVFSYTNSAANNPYLSVWMEMKAMKYGEQHRLLPLSVWRQYRPR